MQKIPEDTLPKLLLRNYTSYGDRKIALRMKTFGIWKEYSWKDYYENVKYLSLGLVSLGFEQGDKLAIIGDNEPEWYFAELAALSAGGVSTGIFTDSTPQEIQYILDHSDSKFVVVKDQEQVDKLLDIVDDLPQVRKVIYWDRKGLLFYRHSVLDYFPAVQDRGRKYEQEHPTLFEQGIADTSENQLAIISYTSGTSGVAKAVMQTHKTLIKATSNWFAVDPWYETDEYLSFLPPAWMTEQVLGLTGGLYAKIQVNFPESPDTQQENLREIGPQVVFLPSRLWEDMVRTVHARIADATRLKRFSYRLALVIGRRLAEMQVNKKKPDLASRAAFRLARFCVLRQLLDRLGLVRVRYAYTAGAALSPDAFAFFRGLGLNLKQAYGLSETGVITMHEGEDIKFESVGKALPGVDVEITEESEIIARGPTIFKGYYKADELTRKVLKEGWFYTGDAGYIDKDGHLIYIDRLQDLRSLASGSRYSPQYIEGRLKFSPYIKDAMIVGSQNHHYVSGIIIIDYRNVGNWAEARRIPYTTFTDLSQKPETYNLVLSDVKRVNANLPDHSKVKKFCLLHKEFDPDEAELTRTRKLRRTFMEDRYKDLIDAIYQDRKEFMLEAEVIYRDGRKGATTTTISIVTVK